MMEEVAFRGAIGSHVRHPGEHHGAESTVYGIVSAILISVLWGLWHYPIVPHASVFQVVAQLLLLQGRGEILTFPLLAQVEEPHGARVRARPTRLCAKHSRLRPVGRRPGDLMLPLPV